MKVAHSAAVAVGLLLTLTFGATSTASAATPRTASPMGAPSRASTTPMLGRPENGRAVTGRRLPIQVNLPCVQPMHNIDRQGRSCRVVNGLFKVQLRDGTFTYTHGPDPLRPGKTAGTAPSGSGQTGNLGPVAPRNPVCTSSNPHGAYGLHAIIAVPSDGSQTISVATFRGLLRQIDGAFFGSAVESGSPRGADLVFDCDNTGAIAVSVVRLATSTAASTFASIVSDLKSLGYRSATRNYAVFFTARMASAGGQGTLLADPSNSATNANNTGGRFAIDYGVNAPETMMHEIGHNLGAVQPGSPHATGSATLASAGNWGHCWEGKDVMCYNDGGSRDPGTISWACADFDHFDCRHDDYFDAVIGAGQGGTSATSWLASHFNIGACYDVFVVNGACAAAGDRTPPAIPVPTQTVQRLGQVSGGLVPVTYTWSATDASGIARYDVWISTNGTFHRMTLASATATSGTWRLTPGSTYQLAVAALDGAGNWSTYAYSAAVVVDAFQEDSTRITYSAGWTAFAGSYFGGQQYSSGVTGAQAQVTFTGRSFAWYGARASNRGQADVWVDGNYAGRVDSQSAAVSLSTAVLTFTWRTSASHTVTLQVVGTADRPTIDVDAFVALR